MQWLSLFLRHNSHPQTNGKKMSPTSSQATIQEAEKSPFPSQADFYRYRKQRGVNLGSWFVLERWITSAPFRFAKEPCQSDLDIARGSSAKQVLERHWDSWMTESDWVWLAERGINTVRIPIGYYHICGADPSVLHGTDFSAFKEAYGGAWYRITNAIVTASRFGIGVLIDLHAAPGKQNRDAHSGTSAPAPQFFKHSNMTHTTHVLSTLVSNLTEWARSFDPPLPNIVGIELLNEPQPGSKSPELQKWYIDTAKTLREIESDIPIYIGDGWMTEQYAEYLQSHAEQLPFMVLDHHLYRCFTQGDADTPVHQHIQNLSDPNAYTPHTFSRIAQKLESAGCGFVIGEWSGALNPESFKGEENELDLRQKYIAAQMALFEKCCGGYFFWTYKKDEADKGWALRDAVEAGVYPSWVGLKGRDRILHEDPGRSRRRDAARDKANEDHLAYWAKFNGDYEHWRFTEGFTKGWDDAWLFFDSINSLPPTAPIPELGFKGPWMKKRVQEHITQKGDGKALWEFEHGFSQGLAAARRDLTERPYK